MPVLSPAPALRSHLSDLDCQILINGTVKSQQGLNAGCFAQHTLRRIKLGAYKLFLPVDCHRRRSSPANLATRQQPETIISQQVFVAFRRFAAPCVQCLPSSPRSYGICWCVGRHSTKKGSGITHRMIPKQCAMICSVTNATSPVRDLVVLPLHCLSP